MIPSLIEALKPSLKDKKILLGITGSIAAFKALDIVRALREIGAEVQIILTDSAQKFVTPLTLETLSGRPVHTSLWDDGQGNHHIDLARWADLFLVAPCSANTLGKMAHGLANDPLTTELLAFQGPVLIAPAMNPAMFSHPAVQENLQTLTRRGVRVLGPAIGITSCGEEGLGRMLEPQEILSLCAETFFKTKNGKKAIISLGPTQSRLDPVRYLTNRSSGKMGAALCWAAAAKGFDVIAVKGPCEVPLPPLTTIIEVKTAQEMQEAVLAHWEHSELYVGAAAVLDWEAENPSSQKMKKEKNQLEVSWKKAPDILAKVSELKKPHQRVIGFAAETEAHRENALKKLKTKGCDAIFLNNVLSSEVGFEGNENEGTWITLKEEVLLPRASKSELAQRILQLTLNLTPQSERAADNEPNRTPAF
jgi:phosphopantothenoylcysteine decarboxylase / phosphopantothenate---cysteine ligase